MPTSSYQALQDRVNYAKIAHGILMGMKGIRTKEVDVMHSEEEKVRFTITLTDELHEHMLTILRREHDEAKEALDKMLNDILQDDTHDLWM